jgi:hypothetical protein
MGGPAEATPGRRASVAADRTHGRSGAGVPSSTAEEAGSGPIRRSRRRWHLCSGSLPPETSRAGEGNRTLMTSLEGWRSAIELRPRAPVGPPGPATGPAPTAYRLPDSCAEPVMTVWPLRGAPPRRRGIRGPVGYVRFNGMWRSLVSAPALGAGGRGFESRHPDQTSRSYGLTGDLGRSVRLRGTGRLQGAVAGVGAGVDEVHDDGLDDVEVADEQLGPGGHRRGVDHH